jgi:hypothetical protein
LRPLGGKRERETGAVIKGARGWQKGGSGQGPACWGLGSRAREFRVGAARAGEGGDGANRGALRRAAHVRPPLQLPPTSDGPRRAPGGATAHAFGEGGGVGRAAAARSAGRPALGRLGGGLGQGRPCGFSVGINCRHQYTHKGGVGARLDPANWR